MQKILPFKNDILQFLYGSKSVLDIVQNIFLEEDQQSRST